ncbi:MAG: NAD(P)/FAD-dependent oxidoreductase [Candidatus Nanopelagicales bacterium]|jgi:phytoene dehydrogenase-like protein|nr:NAD(P)/FAD-dependent oxidoreductase [Candidatus Nanopelagicales bacterium]
MGADAADAVVIGAGPNGLVAANALAEAGWDVVLVEANDEVGGAVRSAEAIEPGFVTDLFSAFYPLAAASPIIAALDLPAHGLRWVRAPDVLAHAFDDGRVAVLHDDPAATAAGLEAFAPGDGDAWLALFDQWQQVRDPLLDALFTPFPPAAAVTRLVRRTGARGGLDLARLGAMPVRALGRERFRGDGGPALLTGNAMHSDLTPDGAGSALFGWLLAMLGQDVGFPVPQGGAGRLAHALHDRATAHGARTELGTAVDRIEVHGGRATGVALADGQRIRVRRGVLADVAAPTLYCQLVGPEHLPARLRADLERFGWDDATLKVNWTLDRPIPWANRAAAGAGTVHLGVDVDGFVDFAADLSVGRMPARPFLLLGQMTVADPTRSPAGAETAWAYTHLPRGRADDEDAVAEHLALVEAAIERVAPGFGSTVRGRLLQTPGGLQASDVNLIGGSTNAGTAALHQQLVFRPTPGLGRPETPIEGLYLAGASAHPGGGVHGACGWNAARVALRGNGRLGAAQRALVRTAWARLLPED